MISVRVPGHALVCVCVCGAVTDVLPSAPCTEEEEVGLWECVRDKIEKMERCETPVGPAQSCH